MFKENVDRFDKADSIMGKLWLGIVAIHIILLLAVFATGNWNTFFNPTPNHAVFLWFFLNDVSAIFGVVLVAGCFTRESNAGKVICYPIGVLITVMMIFSVSIPFLFIGIIVGIVAHVKLESMHPAYR